MTFESTTGMLLHFLAAAIGYAAMVICMIVGACRIWQTLCDGRDTRQPPEPQRAPRLTIFQFDRNAHLGAAERN